MTYDEFLIWAEQEPLLHLVFYGVLFLVVLKWLLD